MADDLLYEERVSSSRTEALFVALAAVFLLLLTWRVRAAGVDVWALVLGVLCAVFVFYSLNYRTLSLRVSRESLRLGFGLFSWNVPLENIADCRLDEVPTLLRLGGAGIHFMLVRGRYRASFNFLEHPRVVIAFRRSVGPVRDLSFSTRQPEAVLRAIREAASARRAT